MSTGTRTDHAALFAILSSLADNKLAIGRRYAYWSNGAPALEAAVAAAAMTQDEIGHARTLYPLLEDFVQAEADPAEIEPTTRTLRYSLAALDNDFQGWSDFVATNFLLDNALTTFFEAAQNSSYEPLRQRARKIVPTLSHLDIAEPAFFNAVTKEWELRQALPWGEWDRASRRLE